MKYLFNIILSLLVLAFTSYVATAGDKFKPLRDIPPFATEPSRLSIASTANEATTPVELSNPEDAIDNAIKTPQKNIVKDVSEEHADEAVAVEKQAVEYKKPVADKKPTTRKAKNRVKNQKKHHANTKNTKAKANVKNKKSSGSSKK